MLDSMTARPDRISLQIEPPFAARVDGQALAALARRVLASEQVDSLAELSVLVTDDETVCGLNKRYRDIEAPTDVLSFRMDGEEGFVTPPESAEQLGEIDLQAGDDAVRSGDGGRFVAGEDDRVFRTDAAAGRTPLFTVVLLLHQDAV